MAYHVYDVSPPAATTPADADAPAGADAADDHADGGDLVCRQADRVGRERCYTVRAVRTVDGLAVESEAAPERCVTPADTFPPAAPAGLTAVASEGAINLIWDPNAETDLAGYLVLRASAPSADLAPVTPTPITETTFSDTVPAGVALHLRGPGGRHGRQRQRRRRRSKRLALGSVRFRSLMDRIYRVARAARSSTSSSTTARFIAWRFAAATSSTATIGRPLVGGLGAARCAGAGAARPRWCASA